VPNIVYRERLQNLEMSSNLSLTLKIAKQTHSAISAESEYLTDTTLFLANKQSHCISLIGEMIAERLEFVVIIFLSVFVR
jgi:hypothetical protein